MMARFAFVVMAFASNSPLCLLHRPTGTGNLEPAFARRRGDVSPPCLATVSGDRLQKRRGQRSGQRDLGAIGRY